MNYKKIWEATSYLLICFILSGCANEFDPLVETELDKLMVFSVLDNRLQSQYCYLQKNYQINGDGRNIENCKIFLIEDENKIYEFRNTVAGDEIFSRYYIPDLKLKRNAEYQLMVVKDSLTHSWSSTYIFNIPVDTVKWLLHNIELHELYNGYYPKIIFDKDFLLPEEECYFEFQTFIEYEESINGIARTKYREIPYKIDIFGEHRQYVLDNDLTPKQIPIEWYEIFTSKSFSKLKISEYNYTPLAVKYTLMFMKEGFDPHNVTIKRAFTVVKTISPFYYENCVLNKWESMTSSRFDKPPVITNITTSKNDGLGMFGAITIDTIDFRIDSVVIDPFQYKDGQKK